MVSAFKTFVLSQKDVHCVFVLFCIMTIFIILIVTAHKYAGTREDIIKSTTLRLGLSNEYKHCFIPPSYVLNQHTINGDGKVKQMSDSCESERSLT